MKGLKSPRCKNGELKGNENYCHICGLDLKEKTVKEGTLNKQENLISLIISIDKEKLAREIIKLINDSQDNKGIGSINI